MVPNENACNVFSSLSELIEDITDNYASCRKKKDHPTEQHCGGFSNNTLTSFIHAREETFANFILLQLFRAELTQYIC
jgi:hypothetical protein